jgi:hypothetical protein
MVESQPSKLLVASSILVSRSKFSMVYGLPHGALHIIRSVFQFTLASSFRTASLF